GLENRGLDLPRPHPLDPGNRRGPVREWGSVPRNRNTVSIEQHTTRETPMRRLLLCATFPLIAVLFVRGETCLSPFVKRLDRPEKVLYVFCVDADAKDNDFLLTIDVNIESDSYGKILHQLDLGSSGNETHHFGYTDDRTHIWGCSLFSNRVFLIDVATDPAKPKLVKVIDSAKESGLTGPHSPYALPGRMLLSFLGVKDDG